MGEEGREGREGGEGGGFKNPREVASMVLLPLVRAEVDVPIIAAGGFVEEGRGAPFACSAALGGTEGAGRRALPAGSVVSCP